MCRTFAPFDSLAPGWSGANASNAEMYSDLYCTAHEHGARVLSWGYHNVENVGCPVTRFYRWARDRNNNSTNLEMFNQTGADMRLCCCCSCCMMMMMMMMMMISMMV
jgi:hypothetical protein